LNVRHDQAMILGFAIQSNIFSNMVARGVLKLGSKDVLNVF
jgi:hypothetical protein